MIYVFNRTAGRVFNGFILKDEHCTAFTPEFRKLIHRFLLNMGISELNSFKFAEIVSHLFEYDNAYRLPIQDLFSETSKEKWNNPSKEIKRLAKIFGERHVNIAVTKKVKNVALLARIALLIPNIKKALIKAFKEVELENLQLDEADRYWLSIRTDYLQGGLTKEENAIFVQEQGWTFPTKQ